MNSFPKGHQKRVGGRFSTEDEPPAKRVTLYLPEEFIHRLDAYGAENDSSRSKSVLKLLDGVLAPPAPPIPLPEAQKDQLHLMAVQRSHPLYKQFRSRHYISDRGIVGQQIQYLIFYGSEVVGVIGGASAVYTNESRDQFFGLSNEKDQKTTQLNSIINNNIFRLEYPAPNLATMVLSEWRKQIAKDWEELYGVEVCGYETFIIESRLPGGRTRNGAIYRADNWELTGITKGYEDTNVRGREHKSKVLKSKKLVYCKWIKGKQLCTEYTTSWNDPEKSKLLAKRREEFFKKTD